jgi:hypothetical protein
LNRIELQIQTKFEAGESKTPLHSRLDLPPQGHVEMPLNVDRSLDMERVTAFELGRAPSPPLVKFRIDSDNFSTDSYVRRPSKVKLLFFFNFCQM